MNKRRRTDSPIRIRYDPPADWKDTYERLKEFRFKDLSPAPVDTMGCDMLHCESASPAQRRFQILISLLLSSQTKDPITADAMDRLHKLSNKLSASGESSGLNIDAVLTSSDAQINECIAKVGFHKKKTVYLRQVAEICHDRFNDDIPDNVDDLLSLPGIGPKMAYLALQSAWDRVEGIGVDTHVHRIASRLRWVPRGTESKGPEATRAALESWLPMELWSEVNHLLVGLGQIVCSARKPLCSECAIKDTCPSSTVKKTRGKS